MNRRLRIGLTAALCGTLALTAGPATAGPEGGQVVAGGASIAQSGAQTLITQTTSRVAIDWTGFNVDSGELVRFVQPSATAAALNRISDTRPSQILGTIEANGRVFLVNPSGVVFGEGARVNVGALVASSLSIDPERFMRGDYRFEAGAGEGGLVVNRGLLQAATGGSVTLLGGAVANEGLIIADYGRVDLGAGRAAVLDFDGDGLVGFRVTEDVLENAAGVDAAAANRGEIRADGGQVVVTARAARDVFSQVVNNEGVIRAARVDRSGGVVRLVGSGGATVHSGTIDVDGATDADTGGRVDVLGDRVVLRDTARIEASGPAGGGTVRIGGDFHGAGADAANAEGTYVAAGARVRADATVAGDGGRVAVWSDGTTVYGGEISARGGAAGGDGGFVEVSGKGVLGFAGGVDTGAPAGSAGTLLLDPTDVNVVAAGQDTILLTDVDAFGDGDLGAGSTAILVDSINTAGTNVVLQAENDVNFNTAVNMTGAGIGLTAQAGNDVNATNTITTNGGAVHLEADSPHATGGADGTGTVTVSADLTTGGGNVTLIGADHAITAAVNAGAGNVNVGLSQAAALTLGGGAVSDAEIDLIQSTGTVTLGQATTAGSDGVGTGATTLTASSVTVNQALTVAAATAASLAVTTSGTFTLSAPGSVDTTDVPLAVTADDAVLGTTVNTGAGSATFIDSDGTGIGLGGTGVVNGLNLSAAELQNVTATGLTLQTAGSVTVNGISAANSNNVAGTTTLVSGGTVGFATTGSVFNALSVQADDGVSVGVGLSTDTGDLALEGDADNAADGTDAVSFAAGLTVASAGALTLDATTGGLSGAGALTLNAADGVTANDALTTAGTTTVNADTDAGDNNGTFTASAAVATGGGALSVTADDVVLASTVNTGAGSATFIDSDGTGIGLGATPVVNGLNLTGAELQNVTATGLTLQTAGSVTVDGISAANSDNIAGTTTVDAGGTVTVSNASAFNTLDAQADNGIVVSAALSTDTGALSLDGDADNAADGNDALTLAAALTGATGVTLDASTGGIVLAGAASATTPGGAIQVNDAVDGGFGLTLNAGAGTVALAAAGAATPLASLTATGSTITLGGDVTTAPGAGNDVTLNGDVKLGSTVTVDAGGAATFGGALDATTAGVQGLTLQAGAGPVQLGAVGQGTRLGALSVAGSGGVGLGGDITAASVDMSGVTGGTVLGADVTVDTSVGNGNLFLNGDAVTGVGRSLTLDAGSGTVRLADVAANGAELSGLNLTAGTVQLFGDVFTNGGLDFSGVTTTAVAGASTLLATDSDNGTVALAGTALEGPGTLQIQAGSGAVGLGAVGQATRLGALAVTTTGTTTLGGGIATGAAGGVDLSGVTQVTLGSDLTIDTTVGNGVVDLSGGAVDGARTLTVQGGTGAVTFGNTGQNVALAGLAVASGGAVSMAATDRVTATGNVSVTGGQTSLNGVAESTGGTLAASSTAGVLQLGQVRSSGAMTLAASTNVLGDGRANNDPRGANVVANSLVVNALNGTVGKNSSFLVLDLATTGVLNTKAAYTDVINGSVTSSGVLFEKGFIKGDAGRGQAAATSVARTLDLSLFAIDFNLFAVEEGGILAPPDQMDE